MIRQASASQLLGQTEPRPLRTVSARPEVARSPEVGMSLRESLPTIDWAKNGRTLVLVVSTQCHYCIDSVPFYREIQEEVGNTVKLVAVLPQPVPEGREFLDRGGVHVDDVKEAPLRTMKVRGTPTLLFANSAGTVTDLWEGKIPPQQENQVLAVLKSDRRERP